MWSIRLLYIIINSFCTTLSLDCQAVQWRLRLGLQLMLMWLDHTFGMQCVIELRMRNDSSASLMINCLSAVVSEAQTRLVVRVMGLWVCLSMSISFLPVSIVSQLTNWLIVGSDWIPLATMGVISFMTGTQKWSFFLFFFISNHSF